MKFLVVGCGSIGKRHIRNLKSLSAGEIIGVDILPERRKEVEELYGIETFDNLEGGLGQRPDAVVVTNPSSLHIPTAIEAAKRGCHLFIEKPLSHSMEGINELISLVEENSLITLIGCNWKFYPSFKVMKRLLEEERIGKVLSARTQFGQYLPDWHPEEDYRKGYSANRFLGGGILLDSHEFDYIRWFLGEAEQVFCFADKLSGLEINTEDTAEVLLRLKGGVIAEIHLDYIQRSYQRSYEFYGEKGTILWDFNQKKVRVYSSGDKSWSEFPEKADYNLNKMYIEEMKHFIRCLEKKEESITDIYQAKRILQIIWAAKESALKGKKVFI